MPLARLDFDKNAVLDAPNPSRFGYHYGEHVLSTCDAHAMHMLIPVAGPIPNPNAGWEPDCELLAYATNISR
jgi:hypothetical protein